ncbi:MAG TPA: GH3 auxin-responsive promoter family protein, partial [Leptospiraceae bacterium]|nr:GH3 auxin-responsive promoter family protein [Leptospiraceae bacterium]
YIGTDDQVDAEQLRISLDAKLKMLNDDYRVERISALKEIFVEILPHKVFLNWMEKQGKIGSQNKFPRVMKNHIQEEWEKFIKSELV